MSTMAVVNMVEKIIRVFDYLGAVLSFAKSDMHAKCESLRAIAPMRPTLQDIITADVEARVVTKKNSCGRNLHRLTGVIRFLRLFLEQLLKSPSITLKVRLHACAAYVACLLRRRAWACCSLEGTMREVICKAQYCFCVEGPCKHPGCRVPEGISCHPFCTHARRARCSRCVPIPCASCTWHDTATCHRPQDAASKAYTDSLASIHTFMVRNTVWAGMYVLPTRAQFMASIGEDEESSRGMAEEFSRGAAGVEASILALYEQAGVIMPAC